MAYILGKSSLEKLQGVHPDLVRVVKRAIEITQQDFVVHEGLRALERQKRLVASGASRTLNSKHIRQLDGYGHAVDLLPLHGKSEISWHWEHFYPIAEAMRQAAKELGIKVRWGGNWSELNVYDKSAKQLVADYVAGRRRMGRQAFIDGPHFELI